MIASKSINKSVEEERIEYNWNQRDANVRKPIIKSMKLNENLGPEHRVVRWANRMRGFYGHPVFLVGSQLTDNPNPHDVDIVIIIPDDEFFMRFGLVETFIAEMDTGIMNTDIFWIWSDEMIKKSMDGIKFTGYKIDFKVYPKSLEARFEGKMVKRLDTRKMNINITFPSTSEQK